MTGTPKFLKILTQEEWIHIKDLDNVKLCMQVVEELGVGKTVN